MIYIESHMMAIVHMTILFCNLNRVRKSKGANSCDALLTVTKDNLYCLDKVIDEYIYLGFHSVLYQSIKSLWVCD